MAMQESSKGAGKADDAASGPDPALSDEQADEFAASFTPAWGDDDGGAGNDAGDAPKGSPAVAAGAVGAPTADPPAATAEPRVNLKQTLLGTAPAANAPNAGPAPVATAGLAATIALAEPMRPAASSAEAVDPDNILEAKSAPLAVAAQGAGGLGGTMLMSAAPAIPPVQARQALAATLPLNAPQQAPAPARQPPQGQGPRAVPSRPAPAVAVSADPFRRPSPSDEDFLPKKSNKTAILVVVGLVAAVGLGLVLRSALAEDPKPVAEQPATGPAVTSPEVPPPAPTAETPAATADTPEAPSRAAAAAAAPAPAPAPEPPATLPAPAEKAGTHNTQAAAAPKNEPKSGRAAAAQPAPRAAQSPAAPKSPPKTPPKTPPKSANGGIVRDNPF